MLRRSHVLLAAALLAACKESRRGTPSSSSASTTASSPASAPPSGALTDEERALAAEAEKAALATDSYVGVPNGHFGALNERLRAHPRVLVQLASASTEPQVVVSALGELASYALDGVDPKVDAKPAFFARLSDPSLAIRGAALQAAAFVGPYVGFGDTDAELAGKLADHCQHEAHPTIRAAACASLASRARHDADRTAEVESVMVVALEDSSAFVVGRTLGNLITWCSPKLMEAYLTLAKGNEPIVRGYAAVGLGSCLGEHRESVVGALEAMLRDASPFVEADAAFALGLHASWSSVDLVLPLLEDERVATTTPMAFTEVRLDGEGKAQWRIGYNESVAHEAMEGLVHAASGATPMFIPEDDKDLARTKKQFVAWWKANKGRLIAKGS